MHKTCRILRTLTHELIYLPNLYGHSTQNNYKIVFTAKMNGDVKAD